ncbi:cinnamoyl-CoA reductase [Dichotomopilus funicola]|uniref:Cinnamoyl-CoA reductase n=1 Tax=Dichotomopilus funicola TaxID=1934379 RepID=A0AAN6UW04_9PEZI|nr:cinnamoyl-CoA reductase [Dichotomopilus funicola]
MLSDNLAIPKGSRILVTGANSYIGSHIVDLLLELGYAVRGTVRENKPWLNALFEKKYGKGQFETVIIPSLEAPGAFESALADVAGVVHVASVVSFSSDPNEVVTPVVAATINALQAASKHSSVKRFVLTSSSTAALLPPLNKKVVVTEVAAWSDSTPPEAKGFSNYAASKTEGEREAWKWIKKNKPGWGRILAPQIPGSTMGWTRNLLKGDDFAIKTFPPQWYVHVRDIARHHAIALLAPAIHDERIFSFAGPFNWTEVLAILHKLRPEAQLPDAPENEGRDLSDIKPAKRAAALLKEYFGRDDWTSMEEALAEGIEEVEQ